MRIKPDFVVYSGFILALAGLRSPPPPYGIFLKKEIFKYLMMPWSGGHPGSKDQILDITQIYPKNLLKVLPPPLPPGHFFLFFQPKTCLYIQRDWFKILVTHLSQR